MRNFLLGVVLCVGVFAGLVALVFDAAARAEPVIKLAQGKTRPQGGIYVGCYAEPRDLNPFTTTDLVAQRLVLQYTHEALLDWDPTSGELRPALAESYERGADDRTWVFTMRDGVRFADGSPLTMADVLFPFEVSQRTKVALGNIGAALGLIEHAEAQGHRLYLRLREPGLLSLSTVATRYLVPKREFFMKQRRDLDTCLREVRLPGPGTGPYRVGRDRDGNLLWRPGQDLLLVQNTHCWRHAAQRDRWNLAGMRLLFVQDQAARFTLLRQGHSDVLVDPNVRDRLSQNPELANNYRVCIYDQLRSGNFVLLWNHRRPFLGDARVRSALTMCFDRSAIASKLMAGQGRETSTWFRPGSLEAQNAPKPLPFDPPAARRLLAEAELGNGRKLALTVIIAAGQPIHRRILELAQQAVRELPIKLDIRPMQWAAMSTRLKERDFDGMLVFFSLDPVEDPFPNFHSSQSESGLNYMGYKSPRADRVLEQARRTSDAGERQDLCARFNRIFHEDQPVTLLAYPLTGVLLHKRFQDADPNKLGLYPERWWVKPAELR